VTQGDFLSVLGLSKRLERLVASSTPEQAQHLRSQANRLTSPDEMGSTYKVLCLGHASLGALPGFSFSQSASSSTGTTSSPPTAPADHGTSGAAS